MTTRESVKQIVLETQGNISETQIAKGIGVSKERVRQLINVLGLREGVISGYERAKVTAKRLGYHQNYICELARKGKIDSKEIFGIWYIKKGAIVIRKRCRICGEPVAKGRWNYCSPDCREIGRKENRKRASWRYYYRKAGKQMPPSVR